MVDARWLLQESSLVNIYAVITRVVSNPAVRAAIKNYRPKELLSIDKTIGLKFWWVVCQFRDACASEFSFISFSGVSYALVHVIECYVLYENVDQKFFFHSCLMSSERFNDSTHLFLWTGSFSVHGWAVAQDQCHECWVTGTVRSGAAKDSHII